MGSTVFSSPRSRPLPAPQQSRKAAWKRGPPLPSQPSLLRLPPPPPPHWVVSEETTACLSLPLAGESPLDQPAAGPGGAAGAQGPRRQEADGVTVTGVLDASLQEAAGVGTGTPSAGKERQLRSGWHAWGCLSQEPGPEEAGRALGQPPPSCVSLRGTAADLRVQVRGLGARRLTPWWVRGKPGFLPAPSRRRQCPQPCPPQGEAGRRHAGLWTLRGDT